MKKILITAFALISLTAGAQTMEKQYSLYFDSTAKFYIKDNLFKTNYWNITLRNDSLQYNIRINSDQFHKLSLLITELLKSKYIEFDLRITKPR